MEIIYSTKIKSAIEEYLNDSNMNYSLDSEYGILTLPSMHDEETEIMRRILVSDDSYTVSLSPLGVWRFKEENIGKLSEFVNRVNYWLPMGGVFQLEYDRCDIKFEYHVLCEDMVPTNAVIKKSIIDSEDAVIQYLPGIIGILTKGYSVEKAIEETDIMLQLKKRVLDRNASKSKK